MYLCVCPSTSTSAHIATDVGLMSFTNTHAPSDNKCSVAVIYIPIQQGEENLTFWMDPLTLYGAL